LVDDLPWVMLTAIAPCEYRSVDALAYATDARSYARAPPIRPMAAGRGRPHRHRIVAVTSMPSLAGDWCAFETADDLRAPWLDTPKSTRSSA